MRSEFSTRADRCFGWAALCGAGLIVAFWSAFYAGLWELAGDPAVADFESAFPVADAWLVVLLLAAGASLLAGKRRGSALLLAAGAAVLYLGLLDLTFYLRQGLYRPLTPAAACALFLNLLTTVGGAAAVLHGYRGAVRMARRGGGLRQVAPRTSPSAARRVA